MITLDTPIIQRLLVTRNRNYITRDKSRGWYKSWHSLQILNGWAALEKKHIRQPLVTSQVYVLDCVKFETIENTISNNVTLIEISITPN